MHVKDILKRKKNRQAIVTLGADASVAQAIELMNEHRIGAVIVTEGEKMAGILSERDIMRALAADGPDALKQPAADFMTEDVYVCAPEDEIKATLGWFTSHRVRHLPVVEDGALHGLISIGDAVKHRLEEVETEARVLRDITLAR